MQIPKIMGKDFAIKLQDLPCENFALSASTIVGYIYITHKSNKTKKNMQTTLNLAYTFNFMYVYAHKKN